MSHYNSSSASGSWQSQRNTQSNSSQETAPNLSGLFNSSAAANLLAQFSSLGNVNINNLAANLPAIVAATNTNSSGQNSSQNNQSSSNNSGYQWHSQNRLATQTNSSTSNQSYLLGPGGTMNNNFNSSKNQSNNKSSQNYDSRNESKSKSNNYSNYSSSSRDRQTPTNRYQNQSTPKFDSSTSNNHQTNQMQSVLPNLTQNPLLAQALLTQLAQTAQQNQTNLVSALAAAVTNNNLNQPLNKRSRSRSKSKARSRSRSRESSQRARNGRMNRNDSNRDIRRVQHSSRSKSPSNLTKRLSYPGSKARDTRENKDRDSTKENSRDPVKESKTDTKESIAKEIKENKGRYSIKLPKLPIDTMYNNVCSLKQRYPLLYIPSDYIDSKSSWLNSFSLSKPLKLNNKCQFHVMNKDALPLARNTSVYDPGDADYRWQVKVMLLSMPSPDEFFKRCCSLAEDNSKEHRCESPAKVIQFLLGNKGKHELMALGGPWSPSLDGPNPAANTQTLINTAVRSVKALTGIDLSPCNQWFRFLDIQYNRNEEFKCRTDGSSEEESLILDDEKYVENTVIFVPNVWSIMPTNVEYQKQMDGYQNLIEKEPDWINEPVKDEPEKAYNGDDISKLTKAENDGQTEAGTDSEANLTANSINADEVSEPTHYSKLDLKKMKVDELRCELAARNLDTKGLKQQLLNRLKDALEAEKAQDGIDVSIDPKEASFLDDAIDLSQQSLVMDEEAGKKETKEEKKPAQPYTWSKLSKIEREKVYRLPVTPHIIVHPSPTFKQNKFECQLVSLSHILDYRKEDNKECSFEVFLFAEFFHEMLLRDNAFYVYKHLLGLREDSEKTSGKRKMSDEDNSIEAKKSKTDEENKKQDENQKQQDKSSFRPKTLYPELLFSFTYIDSNRSNHINEKELEDLFYLIGLNLSRSKCKALLKKLNIKDGLFNYRTLTDRSLASSSTNSFYKIPTDDQIINNIISFDSYLTRSYSKCPIANDTNQAKTATSTIVEIDGSTIDVLTTVRKLEKCEESLNEIDLKYKEALDELDRVKVLNRTLDRHKQKLADETSELKKKLRDEQRFSKDSDDKYLRLKDCLHRTKTQLNKVLDDISDSTRRSQKSSVDSSSAKSGRTESEKNDAKESKKIDDESIKNLNENSQENGYQDSASDENKMDVQIKNEQIMDEDVTKQNSNENEPSQGDDLMLEINTNEKTNDFDT